MVTNLFSMSISKFLANLFGEGKFNILTVGCSQFSNALTNVNFGIYNTRNFDGSFLFNVATLNNWQTDWFVNADFFWNRVGNCDVNINRGNNGYIVSSFLGNFFAVIMSVTTITSMTISCGSWLANSNHLDISYLFKGNFNSFSNGGFSFLRVFVSTDLLVYNFNRLSADCSFHNVSVVNINNCFDGQSDSFTFSFNNRSASLSNFNYVNN